MVLRRFLFFLVLLSSSNQATANVLEVSFNGDATLLFNYQQNQGDLGMVGGAVYGWIYLVRNEHSSGKYGAGPICYVQITYGWTTTNFDDSPKRTAAALVHQADGYTETIIRKAVMGVKHKTHKITPSIYYRSPPELLPGVNICVDLVEMYKAIDGIESGMKVSRSGKKLIGRYPGVSNYSVEATFGRGMRSLPTEFEISDRRKLERKVRMKVDRQHWVDEEESLKNPLRSHENIQRLRTRGFFWERKDETKTKPQPSVAPKPKPKQPPQSMGEKRSLLLKAAKCMAPVIAAGMKVDQGAAVQPATIEKFADQLASRLEKNTRISAEQMPQLCAGMNESARKEAQGMSKEQFEMGMNQSGIGFVVDAFSAAIGR